MAQRRIKRTVNVESKAVSFEADGQTYICSLSDLPADMVTRLALHGLNAKVGDSASDPNDNAIEQMRKTWGELLEGNWSARGTSDGTSAVKRSPLFKALMALATAAGKPVSEETIVEKINGLDKEQRKKTLAHPQIAAKIAEINAQEAAEKAKKTKQAAKGASADDIAALFG